MKKLGSGEEILEILKSRAPAFAQAYTVERIGLFGSCLRGEARDDSDVDILVSFKNPTFDHYMDLKFELEALLGRRVDLVTEPALKSLVRDVVLREVRYAA